MDDSMQGSNKTVEDTFAAAYELLPTLGNDLRDLSGFDVLIYELIQNADDAVGATEMVFDITDNALVVYNDGAFSDCGLLKEHQCPGVDLEGVKVRCDFHSFLKISGQAKRQKVGTTGAFGIGFTSVFQVTDYPELLSSGRHLVLRYDESPASNVHACRGCARDHDERGTTFVLPWARDPDSSMRRGLGVEVPPRDLDRILIETARACIPDAMVFLRRVRQIEVRHNGETDFRCTRSDADEWTTIHDGRRERAYYVLEGEFGSAADALRESHPALLGGDVREASLTIAVPVDDETLRLPIHVVLPTQEFVPIGFRLSAALYPFQDRKRLKFEAASDGESEWNRAAIQGAASCLARDVRTLAKEIGPERAWRLFRAVYGVATHVDDAPDACFAAFWEKLAPELQRWEIAWAADDSWQRTSDVLLLRPEWCPAIDVLGELGLGFVHPSIALDVEAVAREIGVARLDLERLGDALKNAGATDVASASDLPGHLGRAEGLDQLLAVVAGLIDGERTSEERLDVLDGCGIVPCHGGDVAPPEVSALEDDRTRRIFAGLPGIHFADMARIESVGVALRRVLGPLQPRQVIRVLSQAMQDDEQGRVFAKGNVRGVLGWLAHRAGTLSPDDRAMLRSLPIFPSADGLRPLRDLQLPGPFTRDPLGIASTVDLTGIENLRGFLGEECLGAMTLSLDVYVRERLVPALRDGQDFEDTAIEKLLAELASNLDDLDDAVVEQLAGIPLVPTSTGRRPAAEAYFASDIVREVLGDAPVVALGERPLRKLKPLLELIGVTTDPRPADIVAAIERIAVKPKTRDRVKRIRTIVGHLGPQYHFSAGQREQTHMRLLQNFGDLVELEWLPVSGADGWARPGEMYRTDWRTAFESTGTFIDLPEKDVQQSNADFLDLLGVRMRPSTDLVIGHLLNCSRDGKAVARRVYEALEGADGDEVAPLHEEDCILIQRSPARYAPPSRVVRDPGALRGYLCALPNELAGFSKLIANLGIAEHPKTAHALAVLWEIGESAPEEPASEQILAASEACWRILEHSIQGQGESWQDEGADAGNDAGGLEASIRAELSESRTWPDRSGVLRRPSDLYIDDRPALRQFIPETVFERLVDGPRFGTEALSAAGLRFLSGALVEEVVRVPNALESQRLQALIHDREDALARIVSYETGTSDAVRILRELKILEVDEIVVRRSISGEEAFALGDHPVQAHYDLDGDRLFVQRLEPLPWTALAVELAGLLCRDSGSHAAGSAAAVEKVLTTATNSAAHAALDLLQIPRLAMDARIHAEDDVVSESLFDTEPPLPMDDVPEEGHGVDRPDEDAAEPEAWVEDQGGQSDAETSEGSGGAAPPEPDGASSRAEPRSEDRDERKTSSAQRESHADSRSSAGHSSSGGGTSSGPGSTGKSDRAGSSPHKTEVPWRVWVSGRRGKQQQERSEAATELGLKVSRRGVERVLQYEADHRRHATEMPPNNPGFDIESRTAPGKPPSRHIEVKSLSGSWEAEWGNAANPPQMTSEQFRQSSEGRHWLYVVEHALDDDAWVVFPIQSVGSRANRYLFDHGWKEAAENAFGPGLDVNNRLSMSAESVPSTDDVVFLSADRQEGDVPFLTLEQVAFSGPPESLDEWDTWFTSPKAAEDGDFAVQQLDAAMGPTLPLGAVAVFRPVSERFADGVVVVADVGDDGRRDLAIRRAYRVRGLDGEVEGLHLRVDVPGRGDEYEFHDAAAVDRVLGVYVAHQKL